MPKASKKKKSKLSINIKPSKEGSFTAWCKRQGYKGVTQECIQKGLRSKNPAIRKKANFARNARKWNKGKPKNKKGRKFGNGKVKKG